jgi:hypothetical protein
VKKRRWLKTPLGTAYLVDGPAVRAKHVDFIGGGHHRIYPWLPAGQIWIERSTNREQRLLLAHELVEVLAMKYLRVKYDRGHEIANGVERQLRQGGGRKVALAVFLRHLSRYYPKGQIGARRALARRLGALATG